MSSANSRSMKSLARFSPRPLAAASALSRFAFGDKTLTSIPAKIRELGSHALNLSTARAQVTGKGGDMAIASRTTTKTLIHRSKLRHVS